MRKENEKEKEDFWCEECQMYKPMGYCPEHNKYPEDEESDEYWDKVGGEK